MMVVMKVVAVVVTLVEMVVVMVVNECTVNSNELAGHTDEHLDQAPVHPSLTTVTG